MAQPTSYCPTCDEYIYTTVLVKCPNCNTSLKKVDGTKVPKDKKPASGVSAATEDGELLTQGGATSSSSSSLNNALGSSAVKGDGTVMTFREALNAISSSGTDIDPLEQKKQNAQKLLGSWTPDEQTVLSLSLYGGAYGMYNADEDVDAELAARISTIMNDLSGQSKTDVTLNNIMGKPLFFNNYADPCKRVYTDTFLSDLPLVYFIPGKSKINKKLIDEDGENVNVNEYYHKIDTETEDEKTGILGSLLSTSGDDDLRYISFKSNYTEYWKYVQILYSYVYSMIYASDPYTTGFSAVDFGDVFDMDRQNYGIPFYCDRSTTFSESNDNSYVTSRIAEQVNAESSTIREVSMTASYNRKGLTNWINNFTSWLTNKVADIQSSIASAFDYEEMLTNTSNQFIKIVNGAQLSFPEVWQDSKFSRSYDISFRFYSPYGDKRSIMQYVYTPFLALLALALPRQDQAFAYIEPFLVRVQCPGAFNIDMGVITSMTINKGGSDGLWTMDGLPQLLEVTVQVQDLYPSLMQVGHKNLLKYNKNLSMYLETMAGIRADIISNEIIQGKLNFKFSNSFLNTVDDKFSNFFDEKWYEFMTNVFN